MRRLWVEVASATRLWFRLKQKLTGETLVPLFLKKGSPGRR
jgi:hypothetical protein